MTLSSKTQLPTVCPPAVHLGGSVLRLAHLVVASPDHVLPVQRGRASLLLPWKASPFIPSGWFPQDSPQGDAENK